MAETFSISELVIPGTFIRVRAEALISAGAVSTGNIGIVGTASQGLGETHILSDYEGAVTAFGDYSATHHLTRGLEQLYRNGAGIVFARGIAPDAAAQNDFTAAFTEVVKEDVNILVAPELSTQAALAVLPPVVETAENGGRDMIAVIGADGAGVAAINGQVPNDDRVIMAAPAIRAFDAVTEQEATLDGNFTAAAVAGLISTLTPQSSPTNKRLPGVVQLAERFTYGETVTLVNGRVLVLEQRGLGDVRVVRGLSTHDGAFAQITTRRITDQAKAGIRAASNPFIGKLNNERVRGALRGAIAGFLDSMVEDEALITYTLEVTATRQDEIAGRAVVNAVLQPVFSIDFITVTLVLE